MIADGLRVTIPEVDPALRGLAEFRDEELRLASFRYSRTVLAGTKASFRFIEDTPIHEAIQ
jgi:hypothetical protein